MGLATPQRLVYDSKMQFPSGTKWISIKDAAALTQRPERTLRYQLAQGKILGKKDGQSWVIDLNSLAVASPSAALVASVEVLPPPPDFLRKKSDVQPTRTKNSPLNFGLFRELLSLRRELGKIPTADVYLPILDGALENLIAGYLEFSRPTKVLFYRKTREDLSRLWYRLLISPYASGSEQKDTVPSGIDVPWADQVTHRILSEFLPGLSGTLRKLEQKKSSYDSQT